MTSIRLRLLLSLLAMLLLAAVVMGTLTYRNVLAETEGLFDYQLRQMALSHCRPKRSRCRLKLLRPSPPALPKLRTLKSPNRQHLTVLS